MIEFLFKGLLRDKNRSLFPVIIVAIGAALTVLMYCWIQGASNNVIWSSAAFQTGHAKIMTRAYAEEIAQRPNDLALVDVDELVDELNQSYPEMSWSPRIQFGGLLDIPDENGETREQAPVVGMGVNLQDNSPEINTLNLNDALQSGRLPQKENELLISKQMAERMNVALGEQATLISSTMFGSMAMYNFKVVGTVSFGIAALDRGAIIAPLQGVQFALDMQNAASEIIGISQDKLYHTEKVDRIRDDFNSQFTKADDEFSPKMFPLREQSGLGDYLLLLDSYKSAILFVFILVLGIVLWNSGLLASIRRYGEIGVRLAMGESKGHVYRSMIAESVLIGVVGAVIGTIFGLAFSYYLQNVGIDISGMMSGATMMMSNVMRAQVTPTAYYIGLVPSIVAPIIGTSFSGIGIYKRKTAQLFKELEV